MPELLATERRLVVRILEIWERLRGARPFPRESDVLSADLGPDWANCFLIAMRSGTGQWSFRHVGGDLLIQGWDGAIGGAVADCPENTLLGHACAYMTDVLDRRVPISIGGDYRVEDTRIMFRSIMLPLSDDGMRVDSVLGAANCRRVVAAGDLAGRAHVPQL
jgi:hypothetical protein